MSFKDGVLDALKIKKTNEVEKQDVVIRHPRRFEQVAYSAKTAEEGEALLKKIKTQIKQNKKFNYLNGMKDQNILGLTTNAEFSNNTYRIFVLAKTQSGSRPPVFISVTIDFYDNIATAQLGDSKKSVYKCEIHKDSGDLLVFNPEFVELKEKILTFAGIGHIYD